MKGADFREMGSCKKVLKVASLAFDNTFFPMDMLKDSCNITMFVLTVAAIDIYLRSAPTSEPSHIWTLVIDFRNFQYNLKTLSASQIAKTALEASVGGVE